MAGEERDVQILVEDKIIKLEDQVIDVIEEKNIETTEFKEKVMNMELNKKSEEKVMDIIANNKRLTDIAEDVMNNKEKIGDQAVKQFLATPDKVAQREELEDLVDNSIQEVIGREFISRLENTKHVDIQGFNCCRPLPDCPTDLAEKRLVCGTCTTEFPGSFFPIPINKKFTFFAN